MTWRQDKDDESGIMTMSQIYDWSLSLSCPFFAFIREIIHKANTFHSFNGLTKQEFDNIYEAIAKR